MIRVLGFTFGAGTTLSWTADSDYVIKSVVGVARQAQQMILSSNPSLTAAIWGVASAVHLEDVVAEWRFVGILTNQILIPDFPVPAGSTLYANSSATGEMLVYLSPVSADILATWR